ncbi:MAG: flagellar export chaperone FliS [Pirellulales bacterium]
MQQNQYLVSKILTASQPQLQLMLVEGAVRFIRQALELSSDPSHPQEESERLLDKTIDVVEALVRGVSGNDLEISKQLEEQYVFMFRELVACRYNRDAEKLRTVLKLLEYERETWQQASALCQQEEASSDLPTADNVNDSFNPPLSAPHYLNKSGSTSGSLSLEA